MNCLVVAALALAAPPPDAVVAVVTHGDRIGRDARLRAQDRHDLSRSTGEQHLRDRAEARAFELDARFAEFVVGRGSLDAILGAIVGWRDAAVAAGQDPRAAARAAWAVAREAERQSLARHEVGRLSEADYLRTARARADAELALRRELDRPAAPRPVAAPDFDDTALDRGDDGGPERRVSRDARNRAADLAVLAVEDPAAVRARRNAAAEGQLASHWKEFMTGRATLEVLLEPLKALRDGADAPADRLAAALRYADVARVVETIDRSRYESGRLNRQDEANAIAAAAEADVWVLDAAKAAGTPPRAAVEALGRAPVDLREAARRRFEAVTADRRALLERARDERAVEAFARYDEFQICRGTLDVLLESVAALKDAELALAETPPARRAALERRWATLRDVYLESRRRYESGRLPVQELLRTRAAYEDACVELRREVTPPQ